jgi:uncharacterized protein (TIGR01244 family)
MIKKQVLIIQVALLAGLLTGCINTVENLESANLTATGADQLSVCKLGDTKNTHRFGDIILAGQPGESDLQIASSIGVKTIVTLRHPDEVTEFDEQQATVSAGMNHISIPFKPVEELTDDVFNNVRKQLKSAPRPIMIHCGSANRVGAVWIAYRVLDEGLSYEQALAEAQEIGLRSSEYRLRVEEYISNNQ